MNISTSGNTASLCLQPGERYYFKKAILSGYRNFNTCVSPPFPGGSPIARIIHRCYFGMKTVAAVQSGLEVALTGYYPQGEFYALTIPAGERHYVNMRNLVGFCDKLVSILVTANGLARRTIVLTEPASLLFDGLVPA